MILNGFSPHNDCTLMSTKLCKQLPCIPVGIGAPRLPPKAASLRINCSWGLNLKSTFGFSAIGRPGCNLSAASTQLFFGDHDRLTRAIPSSHRKHRARFCPQASNDAQNRGFKYPPMTKRPRWWWRTLACLPYLMPLHETWMYAETAYNIHPFLDHFEWLTYPFLEALGTLPGWFLLAYFFVGYLGIVRRKEWPHFIRFHVVTGMLLEISLQVIGTLSRSLPEPLYWGKLGAHFWLCLGFGFLFTVLKCIACALNGMYADVPFISDAAYIQIPFD